MTRCEKEVHIEGIGYMHAEDDDSPYEVDGVLYCGRCHVSCVNGVCRSISEPENPR